LSRSTAADSVALSCSLASDRSSTGCAVCTSWALKARPAVIS
jgi:hypothetical protein